MKDNNDITLNTVSNPYPIKQMAEDKAPMTLIGIIGGGIVGGAVGGPKGALFGSFALGVLGASIDIENTNSKIYSY